MIKRKKHRVYSSLFQRFIFSNRCRLCAKVISVEEVVCSDCDFEKMRIPEDLIDSKIYINEYFEKHTTPFYYDGCVRKCIHKFKYRGFKRASEFLADEMIKAIERDFHEEKPDFITCIPMTKKHRKERHYNHGKILSNKVSKAFSMKTTSDLLVKIKDTPTQVGLSKKERLENIKGSFKLNEKYDVKDKTILIIDDVLTTGSTLNECSKVLKKSGAARVICATASINNR